MFKKIGINAELQSTDWGSVVQRRATREPVEKGGWSVFHTWFTGGFTLNPVVSAPFRGLGAAGWFGWYVVTDIDAAHRIGDAAFHALKEKGLLKETVGDC